MSAGSAAPAQRPGFTGGELVEFLRELAVDGQMNAATAALHCTAVRKMLAGMPDWPRTCVAELDPAVLFAALLEREGGALKRSTLETYRDTYERAVAMFLEWGPAPRDRRPQRLVSRRQPARRRSPRQRQGAETSEHVLPLAGGRVAQLTLPADLSPLEARRLAGFLATLAAQRP